MVPVSFFKNLRNKHTVTTLYKYFISYFLLLTILTLGYTAAFRVQLKKVYTKELHNQAEKQLTDIDNDLYSSISTIEKIQYLLAQDIPLAMSRYLKEGWYLYQASQTLTKYTTANEIISGICYIHFEKNNILYLVQKSILFFQMIHYSFLKLYFAQDLFQKFNPKDR